MTLPFERQFSNYINNTPQQCWAYVISQDGVEHANYNCSMGNRGIFILHRIINKSKMIKSAIPNYIFRSKLNFLPTTFLRIGTGSGASLVNLDENWNYLGSVTHNYFIIKFLQRAHCCPVFLPSMIMCPLQRRCSSSKATVFSENVSPGHWYMRHLRYILLHLPSYSWKSHEAGFLKWLLLQNLLFSVCVFCLIWNIHVCS